MNTKLSKFLAGSSLVLAFAAHAAPSDFYSMLTPLGNQRFAAVHTGLTADEVRSAIGAPRAISQFPRLSETMWSYDFTDAWGYRSEFEVGFKDGVVTEAYAKRLER